MKHTYLNITSIVSMMEITMYCCAATHVPALDSMTSQWQLNICHAGMVKPQNLANATKQTLSPLIAGCSIFTIFIRNKSLLRKNPCYRNHLNLLMQLKCLSHFLGQFGLSWEVHLPESEPYQGNILVMSTFTLSASDQSLAKEG